jgi:hypothetical protein
MREPMNDGMKSIRPERVNEVELTGFGVIEKPLSTF